MVVFAFREWFQWSPVRTQLQKFFLVAYIIASFSFSFHVSFKDASLINSNSDNGIKLIISEYVCIGTVSFSEDSVL